MKDDGRSDSFKRAAASSSDPSEMLKKPKPSSEASGDELGSSSQIAPGAFYAEDDVDESGLPSMTINSAEVFNDSLTFNSSYYGSNFGYTFVRAQLSQEHNEESVALNHDLEKNVGTVDPFSVLICGNGPHLQFRRQVACSMLATMVANQNCAPFKLSLDQRVHLLLQPHGELEAEKEEYLKLGFVHIATYRRDRDPGGLYNTADVVVDTGSLRMSAVVGDVLLKSGWFDSSSGSVIQTPLVCPSAIYPINMDIFHQKKLAFIRQQLSNCLICFDYLQSEGVRCVFDQQYCKIRVSEDQQRDCCHKLRVKFPSLDTSSFVSSFISQSLSQ